MKYATHVNPNKTPQTQPLLGEKQVKNNAGGYTYAASDWTILDRFLILGTQGGSYYASEQKMTTENASDIIKLVQSDGIKVVERITRVSDEGLAVKNAPAVFALALAVKHGDTETRKAAMQALPKVARTATDFFSFVDQYKSLGGGFGSVVKAGLQNWYNSKPDDKLAYQLVKYRQRDGWTHHDVLHLAHPKANSDVTNRLFKFAKEVDGKGIASFDTTGLPGVVVGYKEALSAASAKGIVKLIEQYNLPREAIPTEYLNDKSVWEAMLPNMPATALLRNLGKLSSIGLTGPMSDTSKTIIDKLGNAEWLQKSRIHPLAVLVAYYMYNSGHGLKGNLSWTVNSQISKALDTAFYATFKNVVPTGKNHLLALDVSGSMGMQGTVAGFDIPGFTARTVSAAMALVIEATEPNTHVVGFSNKLRELKIHSKMSLEEVTKVISGLPFESTDCSLPFEWALQNKVPVDAFVVITDNETYAGRRHPSVALRDYRQTTGRNAKSAVLATSANRFTIADPKDMGMLDMVGFSADVPTVLANFVRS